MKTAKQMRKIQEEATRTWVEHEITFQAKGMNDYFICPIEACPDWLQEELIKKGYTVAHVDDGIKSDVKIKW